MAGMGTEPTRAAPHAVAWPPGHSRSERRAGCRCLPLCWAPFLRPHVPLCPAPSALLWPPGPLPLLSVPSCPPACLVVAAALCLLIPRPPPALWVSIHVTSVPCSSAVAHLELFPREESRNQSLHGAITFQNLRRVLTLLQHEAPQEPGAQVDGRAPEPRSPGARSPGGWRSPGAPEPGGWRSPGARSPGARSQEPGAQEPRWMEEPRSPGARSPAAQEPKNQEPRCPGTRQLEEPRSQADGGAALGGPPGLWPVSQSAQKLPRRWARQTSCCLWPWGQNPGTS